MKLEQSTVSGAEMAALLDHLIDCAAPDKLTQWRELLPGLAAGDWAGWAEIKNTVVQ